VVKLKPRLPSIDPAKDLTKKEKERHPDEYSRKRVSVHIEKSSAQVNGDELEREGGEGGKKSNDHRNKSTYTATYE